MEPFRDPHFVATPAFLRDCLDVSGRLRASGFSNDFERRPNRRTQRQPKRVLLYSASRCRRPACVSRNCDTGLSRGRTVAWRVVHLHRDALFENAHAGGCAPVVFEFDCLPAAVAWRTGPDQIMSVTLVPVEREMT